MIYTNDDIRKKISIIVSTYSLDRFSDIVDLLKSIKIQTYNNIETIIVIDENKELQNKIKNYISNNADIKVIFNPKNKGLSSSRNIGIINATGDVIAFIDDDAIPDPKWAEAVISTFENDDIGAVAGYIVPLWEHKNMSWFPKELFWMISCSYIMTPEHKCEVERGFGVNMAFKKDVFCKTGMFDTNLGINDKKWIGGEDTAMFLSVRDIGKKVMFNPDAKVLHKVYHYRIGLKNLIKRAFNGGLSVVMMKNIRKYNAENINSTENKYLMKLFLESYPNMFKKLPVRPKDISKQIIAVSLVIIAESLGYLYGIKSSKNLRFKRKFEKVNKVFVEEI